MPPSPAEIRDMIAHEDRIGLQMLVEDTHAGNVAEALAPLKPEEIIHALRYARKSAAIEVFEYFSADTQAAIFEGLARKEMAAFLEEMSSDDRADLVKHLKPELAESVLSLVAQVDREDIRKLSSYREGTAGAIMTTDYACLSAEMTVGEALEQLRVQAPDRETIYYVYVVDAERRLLGLVELKDLITARPAQRKLSELMARDMIRVRIGDDPIEVAHTISKYGLIAVPVVDAAERLVGIVTVDDALELLDPEAKDLSASGRNRTRASELGYVERVAWAVSRSRGLFVLAPIFLLICVGLSLEEAEGPLPEGYVPPGLVAFMFGLPLLTALGTSPGARCSVSIARDLAREHSAVRSFAENLYDEMKRSLLFPLIIVAAVAVLQRVLHTPELRGNHVLLFTAFGSIAQVIGASVLGGLTALLTRTTRLSLERLMNPSILAVPDALGILLYFLFTGKNLLGLL